MTTVSKQSPRGWQKAFLRMPVLLARLGLAGWESLLGMEWMLLITTGRKTGKPRYAMVDVLFHDALADTYFIAAGFGKTCDWYRNLQAGDGRLQAQVGRRKFFAQAQELPAGQKADLLLQFVRRRPAYARQVLKMVGVTRFTEEAIRAAAPSWLLLSVQPLA